MEFFHTYEQLKPDPIFGILERFKKEAHPLKHNLSLGVYYDDEGTQVVLPSVQKAAEAYTGEGIVTSYQPIRGCDAFLTSLYSLLFDQNGAKDQMAMIQTVGGTSALRVGSDFLLRGGYNNLYLSDPSWANHRPIFEESGMNVATYPYLNRDEMSVDFKALLAFVETLEPKSVLLLHACCHNPTGLDLTPSQWEQLLAMAHSKQCLCFFDFAYLGFGKGLSEDCFALTHAIEKGYEFMCAFSCSKTFTLYGERVGSLFVSTKSHEDKQKVQSQIEQVARRSYSNPPRFGAHLVSHILNTPTLKKSWEGDLAMIRDRTAKTRKYLVDHLKGVASSATLNSLENGLGFFSLMGLSKEQVDKLYEEGIYLTGSSRINLAALNEGNIDRFIECVKKVS